MWEAFPTIFPIMLLLFSNIKFHLLLQSFNQVSIPKTWHNLGKVNDLAMRLYKQKDLWEYRWPLIYHGLQFLTLQWGKSNTHTVETILNFEFWSFPGLVICDMKLLATLGSDSDLAPSQPCGHGGKQLIDLCPFCTSNPSLLSLCSTVVNKLHKTLNTFTIK